MKGRMAMRSLARPGRLVPTTARRLRGRIVRLEPGGVMSWHSTGRREELLMPLTGAIRVEYEASRGRIRATTVSTWQSTFLPRATTHRVVNPSRACHVLYAYLTG